jgi:hypothetical protein
VTGIEQVVDPVQFVMHAAAETHLAPLEHLHVTHQHRGTRPQIEIRVVRRLHHGRRADHAHHGAVPAGTRLRIRPQVDHLAAMHAGYRPVVQQAAGGHRRQTDPGQYQQGTGDIQHQPSHGYSLAQVHQAAPAW